MAMTESRETVLADCQKLSPTMINGVPYFFDRVYRGLCQQGLDEKLGSLKAALGGKMRMCISGGAAVAEGLIEAYRAHGVPLLQGYGLTEASPVVSACTLAADRLGTVGRALPGVEVRTDHDGEILVRGGNVMLGYFRDETATAEVLHDGWLRTGDIGSIDDDDSYLRITGRKKEIIVTLQGKNIVPNYLEGLLTESRLIAQAMVVGDHRPYLTALIVPNWDAVLRELGLAMDIDRQSLLSHPETLAALHEAINQELLDVSPFEQVRQFVVLERPFTPETGELTPKLTLRRDVVAKRYEREIESMYAINPASERHVTT
jgi:long-chain acyl-CoA synthetase